MTPDDVTAGVLAVLNRTLESDARALEGLFLSYVQVNGDVASDPVLGVRRVDDPGPAYVMGVLGLLNGILRELGCQPVGPMMTAWGRENAMLTVIGPGETERSFERFVPVECPCCGSQELEPTTPIP